MHLRKYRQKYNIFIAEGDKICREFIIHNKYTVKAIYALPSWVNTHSGNLRKFQDVICEVNDREMHQISLLKTHTNVLMLLEIPQATINYKLISESFSLYLDRVQDPGNVGTIIRIADWFGIKTVIGSPDNADFYNPKVVQSTMSSMLNVDLIKKSLNEVLNHTDVEVFGTILNGTKLKEVNWKNAGIIVIGNEGRGIGKETLELIDHGITIPGTKGRIAESLNAAVATGIVCSEIFNNR